MVNAALASSIGNYPAPETEQLSSTVLREINESNTEKVATRRDISRASSNVPNPGEIPQEDPATKPSLENLLPDEGPGTALDSFIKNDIQESLVNLGDGDRGGFVNQRV